MIKGGEEITFKDVFRIMVIRRHIFGALCSGRDWVLTEQDKRKLSAIDPLEPSNSKRIETLRKRIQYKGREINVDVQENYDMIAKFAMPYDYIKHYLPSTMYPIKDWYDDVNEHFQVYHRTLAIDRYVQHPNATLDTLKKLIDWHPSFKPSNVSVEKAALHGHIEIIQYLDTYYPLHHYTQTTFENASKSGCLELVKFLHQSKRSLGATSKALDGATANGHLHVVQWLYENRKEGWSDQAIELACRNDHLDIIQWLYQHGCRPSSNAFDSLCASGSLESIKYLHFECKVKCSTSAMDFASANNRLSTVQFLHQYRKEGVSSAAMTWAASAGHFEMVKWLHANIKSRRVIKEAMDGAAEAGYEDIVRFLHVNRTEGCSTQAMNSAARNGHLQIVQFLHFNRTEGCTFHAINSAAKNGHLNVLEFLFLNRKEGCNHLAMDGAAENNHTEVLEWLHKNYSNQGYKDALKLATKNGHLRVLKWFVGKYNLKLSKQILESLAELASEQGHLKVLKWLFGQMVGKNSIGSWSITKCITRASIGGQLDVLKWLYDIKSIRPHFNFVSLEDASYFGRFSVIRWMINQLKLSNFSAKAIQELANKSSVANRPEQVVFFILALERHPSPFYAGQLFDSSKWALQNGYWDIERLVNQFQDLSYRYQVWGRPYSIERSYCILFVLSAILSIIHIAFKYFTRQGQEGEIYSYLHIFILFFVPFFFATRIWSIK
ncbi:hypothetical protein DFA_08992 [Cavenderia fasciculata]|uniref:Ankyrin repeat-containing protein n=1 Tax=Cavenderia fasciculata TaxID=261658 RepID=F4Q6E4_CACFS|nr:uncharacterized protein DFA_08992 [Cavenderia fasciculata]EGG16454.1 hypothetical protein DFA_08992 [Cavenderia fasciculata]|eukprot:XP_004354854.1 hypothetical protein DFA_08992 [Cavenderia fasciculata]